MWTTSIGGKLKQFLQDVIPWELPRSMVMVAIKQRIWLCFGGPLPWKGGVLSKLSRMARIFGQLSCRESFGFAASTDARIID